MRFEWDDTKNRNNQSKHRVSFELASEVFADPLHHSIAGGIESGEQRWLTFGRVGGLVLLAVAHTWRDDADQEVVRIISARLATKKERRAYENG